MSDRLTIATRFPALRAEERSLMLRFESDKVGESEVISLLEDWASQCVSAAAKDRELLFAKLLQCAGLFEHISPTKFDIFPLCTGEEQVIIAEPKNFEQFISEISLVPLFPVKSLPNLPYLGPLLRQDCCMGGDYTELCVTTSTAHAAVRFTSRLDESGKGLSATCEALTRVLFINTRINADDAGARDPYSMCFDIVTQLAFLTLFNIQEVKLDRVLLRGGMLSQALAFAIDTFRNLLDAQVAERHVRYELKESTLIITPCEEIGVEAARLLYYIYEVLVQGTIKELHHADLLGEIAVAPIEDLLAHARLPCDPRTDAFHIGELD